MATSPLCLALIAPLIRDYCTMCRASLLFSTLKSSYTWFYKAMSPQPSKFVFPFSMSSHRDAGMSLGLCWSCWELQGM